MADLCEVGIVFFHPRLEVNGTVIKNYHGGQSRLELAQDRAVFDEPVMAPVVLEGQIRPPKGTVVTATATYDNSEDNALNPDPSKDLKAGPNGELLEGRIDYTLD